MEDRDSGDSCVLSVLEQQRQNLVDVLSGQGMGVHDQLRGLVDGGARGQLLRLTSPMERAVWLVDYFRDAGPVAGGRFLETVCMCCENMPMFLESQLLSVSGSMTGISTILLRNQLL